MAGYVEDWLAVRGRSDPMRVELFKADSGACSFYRLTLPAQHSGVETQLGDSVTVGYQDGRVVDAVSDADVAVFARPTRWTLVEAIRCLQARGVAVVVDMDDDFTAIDPQNTAWIAARTVDDWRAASEACRIADLVTVTTPALARRYAPHGRYAVLPNYIPSDYLNINAERDGRSVGWAGSVTTHPNDLQVTRGGVAAAVRDTGARFLVVGDGAKVRTNLGLDAPPLVTGILPLADYPSAVARFDVGIVPLADTPFNEAKSALKLLEYSALGVPAVVSPTPDNLRVGLGVVARKPRDWRREVTRLLTDTAYRADTAAAARQAVTEHTVEGNGWRWGEAWAHALTNHLQPA